MRDPKIEQFLNRGAYVWQYHERIDFSEIDIKASEENPARLNRRLDDERAFQYGQKMEAGEDFPAIVLLILPQPHDGCKYIVATGMHRIKGAEVALRSWFDAYVVAEADVYRRESLTRQLNGIEGRGDTLAEQITHVLWLHQHYPAKSLAGLAKEWGLKTSTIHSAAAEQRTRIRAHRFGFDFERSKVAQRITVALGTIHSDIVFQKAAEFVTTTGGVQTAEIKEMVADVKKARDEKSQLAVVEKYRDAAELRAQRAKAKHGRIKPAAINRVMGDVRRLNNQLEGSFEELHVAALEQRPDALVRVNILIDNLRRLRSEIERCERMSRPSHAGVLVSPPELRV